MGLKDTLKERGGTHGNFAENAEVAQAMKRAIKYNKTKNLPMIHREALDAICAKISRICTGDPNHADSWHDIAGYATLVEKYIRRN